MISRADGGKDSGQIFIAPACIWWKGCEPLLTQIASEILSNLSMNRRWIHEWRLKMAQYCLADRANNNHALRRLRQLFRDNCYSSFQIRCNWCCNLGFHRQERYLVMKAWRIPEAGQWRWWKYQMCVSYLFLLVRFLRNDALKWQYRNFFINFIL